MVESRVPVLRKTDNTTHNLVQYPMKSKKTIFICVIMYALGFSTQCTNAFLTFCLAFLINLGDDMHIKKMISISAL
jgi:hypothetical protein